MRERLSTRDLVNLVIVAKELADKNKSYERFDDMAKSISGAIGFELKRHHLTVLFRNYPELSRIYNGKQGRPRGSKQSLTLVSDRVSSLERSVKDVHDRLSIIMKIMQKGTGDAHN